MGDIMKCELIKYTKNNDKLCDKIAMTCHSNKALHEMDLNSDIECLNFVLDKGHESVIEHNSFTFSISEVSRSLTHQLVRHRLASYTQQSQRHVIINNLVEWFVIPPTILNNAKALLKYKDIIFMILDKYNVLIDLGIPTEDSRYILPNACHTTIVVTMNARELIHFFKLRCCDAAQWEIRNLANKMLKECKIVSPIIFKNAGKDCLNCKQQDFHCEYNRNR